MRERAFRSQTLAVGVVGGVYVGAFAALVLPGPPPLLGFLVGLLAFLLFTFWNEERHLVREERENERTERLVREHFP